MIPGAFSSTVKVLFGFRRRRLLPLRRLTRIGLTVAAVLLFGAAGCQYADKTETTDSKGDKQMQDTSGSSGLQLHNRSDIPPIDRRVPAGFQTATFALG